MRFTLTCWLIPLGVIGAALSASSPATAQLTAIEGKPGVIDGDNIEIGDERIRLEGIDTPERWQTCRDERGSEYRAAARTPPTRCGASLATPPGALRARTRLRPLRPPDRLLLHRQRHRHQRLAWSRKAWRWPTRSIRAATSSRKRRRGPEVWACTEASSSRLGTGAGASG